MLVSLTVGKVDAGVAVLLTDDNRLVSITVAQQNSLSAEPRSPAHVMLVPIAIDRIPIGPSAEEHKFREYSRHHRLAELHS